jgi:hypothetical protein
MAGALSVPNVAVMLAFMASVHAQSGDDVYPSDITPPPGTRYPCALTALPRGLPGIAEEDRGYINRTYARVLRAVQAKLVLLKALEENRDLGAGLASYDARAKALAEGIREDHPPAGLENFRYDVTAAIELQREFFVKAVAARGAGRSMADVFSIPEGRQASARLIAAWGKMQARYPRLSRETSDSIYHHLCALDLF